MTFELDPECQLPPHLLALFLRTTPPMMNELVAALERGDKDAARAAAHKLKGSLYAAGASSLAEELETVRALVLDGDLERSRAALREVEVNFRGVLDELARRAAAEQR